MDKSWKRPAILFWRAIRLRCPNCGGAPLFERWVRMRERCPACHMRLERGDEGYQVGAYMFNIVAAELTFAAIFLGILLLTWPTAFDLIFRPPLRRTLVAEAQRSLRRM